MQPMTEQEAASDVDTPRNAVNPQQEHVFNLGILPNLAMTKVTELKVPLMTVK